MKLIVNKNQVPENPEQFLRHAGYGHIRDSHTGNESFVRRLARDHYPRLHMYVNQDNDRVIFNLHLDQKRASYAGSHMHSAEYDSPLVVQEIERLKSLLMSGSVKMASAPQTASAPSLPKLRGVEDVGHGSFERDAKMATEKKSWLARLFS